MAHDPLAAVVPPDRLNELAPASAVAVPPQVLFKLGVGPTNKPEGKLSVKEIPVSGTPALRLLMFKDNDVVPFTGMVVAPNAFVVVCGATTLKFAEAELPVPPFVDVTLPVTLV